MSHLETLQSMLSYRRPMGSGSELAFIEQFLAPLGVKKDEFDNHFLVVGSDPSILWSSHTDTVHTNGGLQRLAFDGKFIGLPKKSRSNCLGADCTAGIFIMIEMIKAKVPGLYVFHYGEEQGCIGSRAIAKKNPLFLNGIKAAVAFDRRKTDSVITFQGDRCCSDTFGHSMREQLPHRYKLDTTGRVTDTRMYMGIIPECSNISVGFYNEHSRDEVLDTAHLFELRDHMVKIDASRFVIERDPKVVEHKPKKYKFESQFSRLIPTTILDLAWTYPKQTARYLEDTGVTFEELQSYIQGSTTERLSA